MEAGSSGHLGRGGQLSFLLEGIVEEVWGSLSHPELGTKNLFPCGLGQMQKQTASSSCSEGEVAKRAFLKLWGCNPSPGLPACCLACSSVPGGWTGPPDSPRDPPSHPQMVLSPGGTLQTRPLDCSGGRRRCSGMTNKRTEALPWIPGEQMGREKC